jgi:TonB family protein
LSDTFYSLESLENFSRIRTIVISDSFLMTFRVLDRAIQERIVYGLVRAIGEPTLTQVPSQQNLRQESADLSEAQVQQLISIAGDHSATEEQWVNACLLLGNTQPEWRKKRKNRKLAIIVVSAILVSAGGLGFSIMGSGPGSVPVTPVISPPIAPPGPTASVPEPAEVDVDFGPYMASMQRRIKRAWFPHSSDVSKHTAVLFKINREGVLSGLRVKRSSGLASEDAAALAAVENAAPFQHLPAGAPESVDIEFSFDYNVFSAGPNRAAETL